MRGRIICVIVYATIDSKTAQEQHFFIRFVQYEPFQRRWCLAGLLPFSTHIVLEQMRHTRNKYSFSSGYTYVFLLSNDEVRKYLSEGADSKVMPTEIEQTKNVFHEWWTRSPGIENCSASLVNEKGTVDNSGLYYDKGSYLLRPAVWITASK